MDLRSKAMAKELRKSKKRICRMARVVPIRVVQVAVCNDERTIINDQTSKKILTNCGKQNQPSVHYFNYEGTISE